MLTTFYYPYAFITISRAMEKMDPSLEEASRISGASPFKTLMTVTLPLMLPSIVAAALLVFVAAASCYGIPSIIGAPGQIYTVTTRIVDYVYIGSQEGLTDATNLAVFLMAANPPGPTSWTLESGGFPSPWWSACSPSWWWPSPLPPCS